MGGMLSWPMKNARLFDEMWTPFHVTLWTSFVCFAPYVMVNVGAGLPARFLALGGAVCRDENVTVSLLEFQREEELKCALIIRGTDPTM
jgi:hypothetical protein